MARHRTGTAGSASDPVRRYLKMRGVSAEMIEGGLDAAIERWDLISRTAKNYDFTLDDWLNDMDLRDIIAGAMAVAGPQELKSVAEKLGKADSKLREATVETGSLWGSAMVGEMAPDPEIAWWYFRRPSDPGETMQEDLDAAGLA